MIRRPPRSTRTDTLFPYTTLFRSEIRDCLVAIVSRPVAHAITIGLPPPDALAVHARVGDDFRRVVRPAPAADAIQLRSRRACPRDQPPDAADHDGVALHPRLNLIQIQFSRIFLLIPIGYPSCRSRFFLF